MCAHFQVQLAEEGQRRGPIRPVWHMHVQHIPSERDMGDVDSRSLNGRVVASTVWGRDYVRVQDQQSEMLPAAKPKVAYELMTSRSLGAGSRWKRRRKRLTAARGANSERLGCVTGARAGMLRARGGQKIPSRRECCHAGPGRMRGGKGGLSIRAGGEGYFDADRGVG